jgi:hypothetical protein
MCVGPCLPLYLDLMSVHQLQKAQKEGRLAETMLDRRAKLKRYASFV